MENYCPRCKSNGRNVYVLPDRPYCWRHNKEYLKVTYWPITSGLDEPDLRFIYEHFSTCTLGALAEHLGIQSDQIVRASCDPDNNSHVPLMVMVHAIIEVRSS